jgi:hypothetical protein
MMSVRSVTIPPVEREAQPDPCRRPPEEDTCCRLDCLVQPRFFCGQLLTNQDLTALLCWTQDKLRLTRYRHGWGVVTGLHVRRDPKREERVIVSPGYAVNCCGDDIILCEDKSFDLGDVCREETDPCAHLSARGADEQKNRHWIVDLYIYYEEQPVEPQTALGRSVCGQVAECEYSRAYETARLRWKDISSTHNPMTAETSRWTNGYKECLDVLNQFREEFPTLFESDRDKEGKTYETGPAPAEIRRWLLDWIDAHPLHQFGFIGDEICTADDEQLLEQQKLTKFLFYLVQDCRNAYLSPGVHDCQRGSGVPLARIWLRPATDARGQRRCQVMTIDPYPPHRRPLTRTDWPAPLGWVNLGQSIWHRWNEACSVLADLGVKVVEPLHFKPETLSALSDELREDDLIVKCKDPVAVRICDYDLGRGAPRVVGFAPRKAVSKRTEERRDPPAKKKG